MVCRKILERISWRVRYFFLEGPVFLPGGSGISSWRVRYFFLESPVFLPGESGISSWRVRYFFLESPVFLPGESGIGSRLAGSRSNPYLNGQHRDTAPGSHGVCVVTTA